MTAIQLSWLGFGGCNSLLVFALALSFRVCECDSLLTNLVKFLAPRRLLVRMCVLEIVIEIVTENGCPLIAVICENHIIDSEGDERLCGQPVQLKDFSLWGDEEARRRWDIVDYCPACKEALAKETCSSPT